MVTERDGWLMIPYDGPEMAHIEIGFDGQFTPAYLDWDDAGRRVAQARVTPERAAARQVEIRVDGELHALLPGTAPDPGGAAVTRTSVT